MATAANDGGGPMPPDDAFAALGNETRMEILQALGRAEAPLAFSALRERVGVADSGQFNYHLNKLAGHFVEESEAGYVLRGAGRRVVEAVLSGAVTETPVIESTAVEDPCHLCGGPVEVTYYEERLESYCTECAGQFGEGNRTGRWAGAPEHGYLGYQPLPPAGVKARTPQAVHRAAWVWGNLEYLALASGICPRCSATVDSTLDVCEDHAPGDGLCAACDRVNQLNVNFHCTNCIFKGGGSIALGLLATRELLAFTARQGLNPVNPASPAAVNELHASLEEDVRSVDPFEAELTFSYDGDELTFTIDDDLNVTGVTETTAASG